MELRASCIYPSIYEITPKHVMLQYRTLIVHSALLLLFLGPPIRNIPEYDTREITTPSGKIDILLILAHYRNGSSPWHTPWITNQWEHWGWGCVKMAVLVDYEKL